MNATPNASAPVPLVKKDKGEPLKPATPSSHPEAANSSATLKLLASAFGSRPALLAAFVVLALAFVGLSAYLSWGMAVRAIWDWANINPWRWTIAWLALFPAAGIPLYAAMGAWSIFAPALQSASELKTKQALDEVAQYEKHIRGSTDPVDFAAYGRKALRVYYHMGQSQVRVSFYIGVVAMVFGFMFLLAGLLLQVLDLSKFPYLRANTSVEVITLGGGLIIEFIAATFLWTYRTAILQLTLYYKRQMLVHSALIGAAMSSQMLDQRPAALIKIIDMLVTPHWEDTAKTALPSFKSPSPAASAAPAA